MGAKICIVWYALFSTKHGNNSESFRTIWNHLDACWSNTSRRGANFIIFYPCFASCDLASEGHYKGDQRAEWGPSLCFFLHIIAWLWIVAVGWLCSAQETKKLLRLMGVPVVWHLWVVICFMSWHGTWHNDHNVALLRWRLQVKPRRSALSTVFCAYDSVRSWKTSMEAFPKPDSVHIVHLFLFLSWYL